MEKDKTLVDYDVISNNLRECWEYYEDYRKYFIQRYYSDVAPQDFIEWCEDELYKCPNCERIIKKDDQERLDNLNGVCDQCIIDGYYE